MMVAIIILGLLGLALIWWHNQQGIAVAGAAPTIDLSGTPVYTPKAPPVAESIAINSIPVIGPLASYTVDKAGNAIIMNKFLEANSSVGPNPGQTEASAGILGLTVSKKGWTYSQVGSGIKKAVEFWDW